MRKISKNLATTKKAKEKMKGGNIPMPAGIFVTQPQTLPTLRPFGLEEKIKWTFDVKIYFEHILWNSLWDWKTGKRSFVKTFVLLEPRLTRSDWCLLDSYLLAAQFFAGKRMLFGITLITSPTFSLLQLKSDWRCKSQNEDGCEDQPNRV